MGDAADGDSAIAGQFGDVVGGGFAFHGGVGGENEFFYLSLPEAPGQLVQPEILGTNAIEGGQVSMENEEKAIEDSRLVDGQHISRGFHDAQLLAVPGRITADGADFPLGQGSAKIAAADIFQRFGERLNQLAGALPVVLKQVKRHALGRFRAHARQTAQRLHQALETIALFHGNIRKADSCRRGVECLRSVRTSFPA